MSRNLAIAILVVFGAGVLDAAPGFAATLQREAGAAAASAIEWSAQSRQRRARPRVRVTPRYPYRRFHSPYPLPYTYEYPGPNAVRQCVDWYATERRASGTVIVPRMRCWWAPG
jgi:hypothetical protein